MPGKTLLIEIGTEELPPKSLNRLRKSFEQGFIAAVDKAGLGHGQYESFATPRRLAVRVEDLADRQPDQAVERRGPAVGAAYDSNGKPTKALSGFMGSCGITDPAQLEITKTKKGEYVVYRATEEGKHLSDLLESFVESALRELPSERWMRWGKSRVEFVRPVEWTVCLYGKEIIPVAILGTTANGLSQGHRFMSDGSFEIGDADEYVKVCREHKLIVSFDDRKDTIRQQIISLAAEIGNQLEIDEDLLDEVTALVEWPKALAGRFDERFLKVPREVLISAMKEHQRYFHLVTKSGQLAPRFITIANIESEDEDVVISGNERVIRPRLSDAVFFFDQDTKSPLSSKVERLGQVVFQTDLGSYLDKSNRITELSAYLAEQLGARTDAAKRAGELCKADLVTDMVGEFPDLQGIMGGHYARHDGEDPEVAAAIEQHYRPTQSGGLLPEGDIACCVSLADKLDTLVGLFGINQPPSGSKDPFALRRQAVGIIRICIENQLDISLFDALSETARVHNQDFDIEPVCRYVIERLRHYYHEQGIAGDVVDAAMNGQSQALNLFRSDDVVKTLQSFKDRPVAASIVAANKRVANILKKSDATTQSSDCNEALLSDEAERALFELLSQVDVTTDISAAEKLERLSVLQEPVDRFFDEVLVMADDESVRNNRLVLLGNLREKFLQVADFSLLQ